MSNIIYTEIVFKIKEEHIKFTKVTDDGSVHFTLEMPVAEQAYPHCEASTRKAKGKLPKDVKFGSTQHRTMTAICLPRCYKCYAYNHTFLVKKLYVSRYL